mgnify:CR=1 FL=1
MHQEIAGGREPDGAGGERMTIPKDDPFYKIIDYLNENGMQGETTYWKMPDGVMEVYWHLGWNKRMLHVRELPEESQP